MSSRNRSDRFIHHIKVFNHQNMEYGRGSRGLSLFGGRERRYKLPLTKRCSFLVWTLPCSSFISQLPSHRSTCSQGPKIGRNWAPDIAPRATAFPVEIHVSHHGHQLDHAVRPSALDIENVGLGAFNTLQALIEGVVSTMDNLNVCS
jgi:hypothetical protein